MRRAVALVLVAMTLTGCASPSPDSEPTAQPPTLKNPDAAPPAVGVFAHGKPVDTANASASTPALVDQASNATAPPAPPANGTAPSGPGVPAPTPAGNLSSPTNGTSPPANATQPTNGTGTANGTAPPPSPAGNGTGSSGNGTGSGTGNATSPPAAPPSPPPAPPPSPAPSPAPSPGREEVRVAEWHVNDTHTFRGNDSQGRTFNETRRVLGNGTVAGIPVYQVKVDTDYGTNLDNLTVSDLNHVNRTGFVTMLYNFTMYAGKTWTYGYDQAGSKLSGQVQVLGIENVTVAAGTFHAWHLHADVTRSASGFTRTDHNDYWYAAVVKDTIKVEATDSNGGHSAEELVYADLN